MLVKKLFQMANVSLKRRFVIFLKVLLGTLIASLALLLIFCTIGMWQDTPFITGAVMISFFVLLCTGGIAILLFLLACECVVDCRLHKRERNSTVFKIVFADAGLLRGSIGHCQFAEGRSCKVVYRSNCCYCGGFGGL